jgi:peptidylprolyl isomerase
MSIPMPARLSVRAAAVLLSSGLLLSACGGGDSSSSASQDSAASSSGSDTAGNGSAPGPSTPTASAAPKGDKALSGMPAVSNATDLKKKPGIAKGTGAPPTGLVVRDLVVGTGQTATAADTVNVQYVGVLYANGKEFDSSWSRGPDPATFPLSQVVPGFAGGIVGMKVGGRREIVIPGDLGYGPQGSPPDIGPNAVLVFVVDLVSLGQ